MALISQNPDTAINIKVRDASAEKAALATAG
jgi:hypothetical protein